MNIYGFIVLVWYEFGCCVFVCAVLIFFFVVYTDDVDASA